MRTHPFNYIPSKVIIVKLLYFSDYKTIELEGGSTHTLNVDSGDPGDNHLDVGGNVTIKAIGDERAVIDASGLSNPDIVLHIYDDANVNLENLTITGGIAEGDDDIEGFQSGGGIVITETSNVTITDSSISGNSATDAGGGIFAGEETTVTVIDSEISNNQADIGGGGIFTRSGDLTIQNSRIAENSTGKNPNDLGNGLGGGIYIAGGRTNIVATTIAENNSLASGGGISVRNAEVNVYSSTINDNGSDSAGGGIDIQTVLGVESTIVRVTNSTISGNVANSFGGGLYASSFSSTTENILADISNSTITNNIADVDGNDVGNGGGIFSGQDNLIAVENSILAGNFDSGGNVASDVSGLDFIVFGEGVATETQSISGDRNNLIGTLDEVEGTIGTGSDLVGVDPLLTPLQDNGGATQTHALLENSPAIDGGNNALIAADRFDLNGDDNIEEPIPVDQLGSDKPDGMASLRIFNETVDIGAVEFGSTASTPNNSEPNSNDNTVYRFFNNDTGVHFYTANETERDAVEELPNFSFEGGSYQAVDPLTGMPEPQPVYRFLNQDTGVHLYTIAEAERDATQELSNFSFEGEAFFAYETQVEDSIPILSLLQSHYGGAFLHPV